MRGGDRQRGTLEFWLKILAAVSRALMIHDRRLSCLKVTSLLMVCPGPGQMRCAEVVCEGGGMRGPGVGDTRDRQVGPGQLQWPVALLSPGLSGLIGARHDTLVIVHNKISPNLAKYICHENVTSLNTSRCKLSIVYWINIGPYFGFQSCSYYQYLMMLVTQNNRWHADYTGGRTNAVLKGDRGLFDDETLQIFANFHHFLMVSDQV